MGNLWLVSGIPPVSRFRLLVASAVLGAVVAVGAIAFLAACEVVTRLALTNRQGISPEDRQGKPSWFPLRWKDLPPCAPRANRHAGGACVRLGHPTIRTRGGRFRERYSDSRVLRRVRPGSTAVWQPSRSWRPH